MRAVVATGCAAGAAVLWAVDLALWQPAAERPGDYILFYAENNTYWARDLRFSSIAAIVLAILLAGRGGRLSRWVGLAVGAGWIGADLGLDRADLDGGAVAALLAVVAGLAAAAATLLVTRRGTVAPAGGAGEVGPVGGVPEVRSAGGVPEVRSAGGVPEVRSAGGVPEVGPVGGVVEVGPAARPLAEGVAGSAGRPLAVGEVGSVGRPLVVGVAKAGRRSLVLGAAVGAALIPLVGGIESPTDAEAALTPAAVVLGVLLTVLVLALAVAAAPDRSTARSVAVGVVALVAVSGLALLRSLEPPGRYMPMLVLGAVLLGGVGLLTSHWRSGRPSWPTHLLAQLVLLLVYPGLVFFVLILTTFTVPVAPWFTALAGSVAVNSADSDTLYALIGAAAGYPIGWLLLAIDGALVPRPAGQLAQGSS